MRRFLDTPHLLRLYRAGVLVAIVSLIHFQTRWLEAQRGPIISVRVARKYFSTANRVQLRDAERGLHYVVDSRGEILGLLLTTSPQTDDIIGYSGPNNVLVALDRSGAIVGVELLQSGDTEEHVQKVERDTKFFRSFVGWKPNESGPSKVAAVAGATLTSYAIAEAIQQRLAGAGPSLRFPEPVTLDEVRALFTNATRIVAEKQRLRVFAGNELLGYALRTSPQADNVGGYRGPTEALVALAPDGSTVTAVRVRSSYDTTSYVDQIRSDERFLKLLRNRTLEQLATLDVKKEKIEGVSGATQTSFAIAEGLKRRAAAELKSRERTAPWRPKPRDYGIAVVIAGALVMSLTSLRGYRWLRLAWQCLLIGYVGLINADLLSLALFGGWAAGGAALKSAPGLVLLAAAAFLVPLASRRQLYCHHICPHGAAQQLMGRLTKRRWMPPLKAARCFELLPPALLGFALAVVLIGWRFDLADIEAFDAWVWRAAGAATLTIAAVGLVASAFVPQAYCRFGCPTGALLNFLRSTGSADHWGRRDWAALAFLATSLIIVAVVRATPRRAIIPEPATFTGRTMGTTWMVKIRDEVADPAAIQIAIAEKFEWCEKMTSHWRTNTDLAQFNFSPETNAIFVPWPVVTLARRSQEISRATDGAFDITVGPLVQLWGFGPPPRRTNAPTEAEIAAVLPAIGWEKLELLNGAVRKQHPELRIDFSAIAPGWAIDQITELLDLRGFTNFLVESGGELRARGSWRVAIEHPARVVTLSDESLGTSGTYRQNYKSSGREYSHLIDPRTGHPITHNTVSVSVLHTNCGQADAWGAALNVLGADAGLPLAERLGLAAQFVVEKNGGALELRASSVWNASTNRTPGVR